jgi:rhodanese-related sulfurtransferase
MTRFITGAFRLFAVSLVMLAMIAAPSFADYQRPETPMSLPGGTIIDAQEAQRILNAGGAFFFDLRSPFNYGKGHIPGAVSLPYKEDSQYSPEFDPSADKFDLNQLPAEKSALIVFYSHGTNGWKAYKAAVLAIKSGYTSVKWLRSGFDGWAEAGHPIE